MTLSRRGALLTGAPAPLGDEMNAFGLQFEAAAAADSTSRNRVDVACFVGCVGRKAGAPRALPAELASWLRDRSLVDVPGAPDSVDPAVLDLLQLPVPIDGWRAFRELFEPESRPRGFGRSGMAATYLGQAVRSFFAQGGRRCFVVRVGDPVALDAPASERDALLRAILPDDPAAYSARERLRWRGFTHLLALPEVAFLSLPDLVWLFGERTPVADPEPDEPAPQAAFVECSEPVEPPVELAASVLAAPRYAESQLLAWAGSVHRVAEFLRREHRTVQCVSALPLPEEGSELDLDPMAALVRQGITESLDASPTGLASAFVQLCYPWHSGPASAGLPESWEPPDGALCGILARQTLANGTFRSAAGQPLLNAQRLYPELSRAQRETRQRLSATATSSRERALQERVSLFAVRLGAIELASDVTLSGDESYRPATSNRLMSVWVRALYQLGLEFVFDASNELVWSQIRQQITLIGERLLGLGALRGDDASGAFEVRCDRSTMSQNDLDGGRVVAEVTFSPATPVTALRVAMNLDESQRVSVSARGGEA